MQFINQQFSDLKQLAEDKRQEYMNAAPFSNICFDNFFNEHLLRQVVEEFPDLSKGPARKFDSPTQKKLAGQGESRFGPTTKRLMRFLNSEIFLGFLNSLTGIEEVLMPDPYFSGGGQHEIKPGGLLKVHADFNKHPLTGLDRRLNVLVYLNESWKESYGGHFEMWNEDMTRAEKKFLPVFNRLVIFSTTDTSYHGHPDPLKCPEGLSRKSLALYYYSNGRPKEEVADSSEEHSTLFVERKDNPGDIKAVNAIRLADFIPPIIKKIKTKIIH